MKTLKLLFAACAALLMSFGVFAGPGISIMSPKAVLSNGGKTLTFVYDTKDYGVQNTDWFSVKEAVEQDASLKKPWTQKGANATVTEVVFADSFGSYKPVNCYKWFSGFSVLTSIRGIGNLDVSSATSLKMMFMSCSKLTTIDVSQFDTAKVTTMFDMFSGCSALTTIYASSKFVTTGLASSDENVFSNCSGSLVGGKGTTWDKSYKSAVYAKIDGGPGDKGYFTEKTAKAVWNATEKSLTFVFDAETSYGTKLADGAMSGSSGWFSIAEVEAEDPDESYNVHWYQISPWAEKVVIDPSFADYRPKHCAWWFNNCQNEKLKTIAGLQNLNVSKATNLDRMFANCENLAELDLSNFNTKNVTSMWQMFRAQGLGYTQLKTIYATDKFVTNNVTAGAGMFGNLKYLAGGNGTVYAAGKTDVAYAHIDKAGAPGYFTAAPVAVYDSAAKTLTFYADGADHSGVEKTVYSVLAAEGGTVPWLAYNSDATKAVFDPSFRSFRPRTCAGWFEGFDQMTDVNDLENLDTSSATSFSYMFYGCEKLTSLNLTSFVTTNATDMSQMFNGCSKLVTILATERFSTTKVTSSVNMFANCNSLKGGNSTKWAVGNPKDKTYAHIDGEDGYGYFTRPTLPVAVYVGKDSALKFYYDNKDHSSEGTVYYVDEAEQLGAADKAVPWHDKYNYIKKVEFDESFADYQPKSCARWLYDFVELTSVIGLPYLDVSKTTTFELMFYNCQKLDVIDCSAFKTPCLTKMFGMFNNCSALKKIYATESFSIDKVTGTAGNAFQNCANLVGGEGSTVAKIGASTVAYARLDKGESARGLFSPAPVAVYDATEKTLTFCADGVDYSALGLTVYSVIEAGTCAPDDYMPWSSCNDATSVVFNSTFKGYKPKHCGSWFDGFSALTEIDGLENLDTSASTSFFAMFNDCNTLTGLDLSGFDTSAATNTACMFANCYALKELDLCSFKTSKVTDMKEMFYNCSELTKIYATTAFTVSQIKDAANGADMFAGCESMPNYNAGHVSKDYATFDPAVGYFTASPVAVYDSTAKTLTFYCDGEDHSGVGKTVFSVLEAEAMDLEKDYAPWYATCRDKVEKVVFGISFACHQPTQLGAWFYKFEKLYQVVDLKYLDTSKVTNMDYLFSECSELDTLDLSNFNTANVTSMKYLFYFCQSLTELDLSTFDTEKVTDMEDMFARCDQIRKIYVSKKFVTAKLAGLQQMFGNNQYLVGGNGTEFSIHHDQSDYAHLDGGTSNPGYFSAVPVAAFDGATTLTFYADGENHEGGSKKVYRVLDSIAAVEDGGDPLWDTHKGAVKTVVFDASFAGFRPESCESWFDGFSKVTAFNGLANLDVSSANYLSYMFRDCSVVTELDLSGFNTSLTQEFDEMFYGCKALVTIKASPAFVVGETKSTSDMFTGCTTALTGGNGTKWSSDKEADWHYAQIDMPGQAGYFTGAKVDIAGSSVTFDPIPNQTHTGSPLTPAVTMKYLGAACTENVDYTVAYSDNTEVGTATVTVTGIGFFTGTKDLTFKIVSAPAPGPGPSPTPAPKKIPTLFDDMKVGDLYLNGATYNGFIGEDELAGTFTLVVKKPKKGATSADATLTVVDAVTGKKVKTSGSVDMDLGVCTGNLKGLFLGQKGLTGELDEEVVQGAVDAAKAKDNATLAVMNAFNKKTYAFVYADADGNMTLLTATFSAKGKAKIAGTSNGVKVSGNAQMSVGDRCAVPFVYAKGAASVSFVLWFDKETKELTDVTALGKDAKLIDAGAAETPDRGEWQLKMAVDDVLASVPNAIPQTPTTVDAIFDGKKFNAGKAPKVSYNKITGRADVDWTKGSNLSGLSLKYSKGAFSGSFTVYEVTGGKLVKNKFTVVGVIIDGVGYATATNKKIKSIPVTLTR